MDSDRMGAMLETDFRTVLRETGKASLSFPLASGTLVVDAFARHAGDGKRVPPQNYSISGFNSERGSFAEALYVTADALLPDGTPYLPQRGHRADVLGRIWQVRAAERVGLNRGVLTRVVLVSNASRGDRGSVG